MISIRPTTPAGRALRRLLRVPVTRRATTATPHLSTVDAHGVSTVRHVLRVPPGACPVSGNPLSGTISIEYAPSGKAIEVVTLHDALLWACSGVGAAPRSVEELAAWMAGQASAAVGCPCVVVLDLLVRPGRQRLVVTTTR